MHLHHANDFYACECGSYAVRLCMFEYHRLRFASGFYCSHCLFQLSRTRARHTGTPLHLYIFTEGKKKDTKKDKEKDKQESNSELLHLMANLFMRWNLRAVAYDGTYVTDCAEQNLRLNLGNYILDLADQIVRA